MTLMFQSFPTPVAALRDEVAETEIGGLKTIIEGIRNFRRRKQSLAKNGN